MIDKLLKPIKLGELNLANRIFMAPMTRARTNPGGIPSKIMAQYYAQRASAGLIISEASEVSLAAKGYSGSPGIYNTPQMQGWQQVTQAVSAQNGNIFCQLWHVGRMANSILHAGRAPLAPSPIQAQASVWVANENYQGMLACDLPKAMTHNEILQTIDDYIQAAKNAIACGFAGVEIHAANGYLPDQFMRTCSNLRNDQWGKNLEGRLAFIKDIVRGISQAIGASRCAIRLSPFITHRSMVCSEILATTYALVAWLDEHQLAYLHFAEADWEDTPLVPIEFRQKIRKLFPGIIVVAGNLDAQKGERLIKQGYADAIAFGRNYIANPNLVEKIKYGLALNPLNNATIMGSGAQGYTDYPTS